MNMERQYQNLNIFVSGVSGDLSEFEIGNYFGALFCTDFGCVVPVHSEHKQYNKGYAILTCPTLHEKNYILRHSQYVIKGRLVHVMDYLKKQAREKQKKELSLRRVFICSKRLSSINLFLEFSRFGEVEDAYVIRDLNTYKYKNFGFILFKEKYSARMAIQSEKLYVEGLSIKISEYSGKNSKQKEQTDPRKSSSQNFKSAMNPKFSLNRLGPSKKAYFIMRRVICLEHKYSNIKLNRGRESHRFNLNRTLSGNPRT